MKSILFRVPAFILADFKDGMNVAEMGKHKCTYSYISHMRDMLVKEELIKADIDTTLMFKKRYILTDKGVVVQDHILKIMEVLHHGEIDIVPKA